MALPLLMKCGYAPVAACRLPSMLMQPNLAGTKEKKSRGDGRSSSSAWLSILPCCSSPLWQSALLLDRSSGVTILILQKDYKEYLCIHTDAEL